MTKLLAFFLFNWLLLSQGNATDTTTTIAAFGDSLFAGYGLPPDDAFPAQLEARLKADGYHVTVINDGISGDTTAGGVDRLNKVVEQKPVLVLLEFGGNDLLRAVPPGETRKNLDTMLTRFKRERISVLLIGEKAPLTMGAAFANNFNAIFSELSSIYSVSMYPFFLEGVYNKPQFMQEDGIHPNKEGVAMMVTNLYPQVAAFLKK